MKTDYIAANIKSVMAYEGWKAKEMAKACKVSSRTWARWMKDPSTMSLPYLFIIADHLNVKPSTLLEVQK